MNTKKWKSIGTVLGETNISEFYFSLKNYKAKKGDIITTESKVPSSEGKIEEVTVWGKISSIESSNVFFPTEAAQELTNENINIRDFLEKGKFMANSSPEDPFAGLPDLDEYEKSFETWNNRH